MQKNPDYTKGQILKAIEPKDDIYEIYSYSSKTRNNNKSIIRNEEIKSTDNINKINITTNSNNLNIPISSPKTRKINHKSSFSFGEIVPPKKYFSKFQQFKNFNDNKNKNNDINFVYIPGLSYTKFLTEINEKKSSELNKEKLIDTSQRMDKTRSEEFDEQLYNKLMYFDNLANNITAKQIYSSSEYIINKDKKDLEKPECIIHNVFLTLVIKDISKKIEIRRLKDNKVISIDYVYNLLQNEIEKMKGAVKKSIKIIKNKNENNSQNALQSIDKILNTDFISYLHFSKQGHIRNKSYNNNSETRYSDDESDIQGKKFHNNSGIMSENNEKFMKNNNLKNNYYESDRYHYNNLMDFNDNFINHNAPYKMIKNNSYIIPNLFQRRNFENNKNIDFIDSKTGKLLFKDDGSFNISVYDKNGMKITNPNLNNKSILYYDKNGDPINIKKLSKIKLYDQQGNLIENPNLDDSNIKYYDENGKLIQTQIQFQYYDNNNTPISNIKNSDKLQYYDTKEKTISNEIPIKYYNDDIKDIIIPKGYKTIDDDKGKQIIVPEGFNYIINNEGKKILVDEIGNEVNEDNFIINESENYINNERDNSINNESDIEVEGVNEKGEKIKIRIKKKICQRKKRRRIKQLKKCHMKIMKIMNITMEMKKKVNMKKKKLKF